MKTVIIILLMLAAIFVMLFGITIFGGSGCFSGVAC